MSTGRFFLAGCLCAAALTFMACSENPARLMPSGPSPIQSAASSASDRNSTTGTALEASGVVQDRAVVAAWASQVGWAAVDFEAEGAGEITAKTGSCPTVTFTILGIPVTTNDSTSFVNGACADLATGRRVNVRAVLVNTGGVLSVSARRVEFQGDTGRRRVAGEGTVASLTGTCPNLRMVVNGIHVSTNESTVFESGECGNLRPGTKVHIEGDTESDRSLVATRVRIIDQPGGRPVEGEGNVGGVHGTCPTLTMVVSGYPVMTTSSTVFTGGVCTDVRPGSRIFVRGTIEGGSVLASEVDVRSHP